MSDDGPLFARARDDDKQEPLSVAALNRAVRLSLESNWADVFVTGELSDVTRASSGHAYFTLNDEREQAQIRCVMFRGDVRRARARLQDGERVRLRGGLSLYEARGSFQLIVRTALPAGEGELAAQFRRTLEKLRAEGLTLPERKRALPLLPRTVGLVTSDAGAALHDILRVSKHRCPSRIVLAPCRVQGEGAAESIVRALQAVQRIEGLDVVIVARGGGSAEDLWAFNDERVARAIAACRVPVVSGVGHEVDVTIADHVADVRAATPSNAAELVWPERRALLDRVQAQARALERALETRLGRHKLRLSKLEQRLGDPRNAIARARRSLSELEQRVARRALVSVQVRRRTLAELSSKIDHHDPRKRIGRNSHLLAELKTRLASSPASWFSRHVRQRDRLDEALRRLGASALDAPRSQLSVAAGRLEALSPLRVLARGYAIALDEASGRALTSAEDVAVGATLRIQLHRGGVHATVLDRFGDAEPDPPEA